MPEKINGRISEPNKLELEPASMRRQMSFPNAQILNHLTNMAEAHTPFAASQAPVNDDQSSEQLTFDAMSACTGLERAGLPRSTSIIEKLTNMTYTTGECE